MTTKPFLKMMSVGILMGLIGYFLQPEVALMTDLFFLIVVMIYLAIDSYYN